MLLAVNIKQYGNLTISGEDFRSFSGCVWNIYDFKMERSFGDDR